MHTPAGHTLVRSLAALIAATALTPAGAQTPTVRLKDESVVLSNKQITLAYNMANGAYRLTRADGTGIVSAGSRWGSWASDAPGTRRTWSVRKTADALGKGLTLRVAVTGSGQPKLLWEATLYEGKGFVVLRDGLQNTTRNAVRLKAFMPMAAGALRASKVSKAKTLDGYSGALQTQVLDGLHRTSNNNLLLTYLEGGRRRSIVMGGLTYREFCKVASSSSQPLVDRRTQLAEWGKVAGYLDCGAERSAGDGRDVHIETVAGEGYTFPGDPGTPWANTIAFDPKAVVFDVVGLDPGRDYTLGLTWWDQNNDGRRESVWVEPAARGADRSNRRLLIPTTLLPAWEGKHQGPGGRRVPLPKDAYPDGRCRIVIQNDAPVPNAVVSEVWLWQGSVATQLERIPTASAYLNLAGTDPVGRIIEPGETWLPEDRFYIDLTTSDPFEALEAYGRRLRIAQNCRPNPYDFPTVCAWYAGVWKTPGAQNNPGRSRYGIATTPGLVEEAQKMRESGFLDYSRAAARLVPDNYTANNPQGWWDDAHWRREGFYVAPYETSRKWGRGMHERGALAFTYFQPSGPLHSLDFRESHKDLLLGEDVGRNLDYTKPATLEYLRGVYANMRGAVDGMMFDYCDDLWNREASGGGFWDKHTTATAFYRACLFAAKTGLGPNSWIHERALGAPGHDIALGISDSQRTSGDTDKIDPAMVSRSGLRWYKNRAVIAYDMDSKEVFSSWKTQGFTGTDRDGRRMMLTMAYVAASRLLLANSFREMTPEVLYDLERTFPYPWTPASARPVDAFVAKGWPQVYDLRVNAGRHQVTIFNATRPTRQEGVRIPLSRAPADGGLGLSASKRYHVYDFWNDRYVGLFLGSATLKETLRPGEARMLAVQESLDRPQVISTNRHILQGSIDLVGEPKWDGRALSGSSKVVRGDPYRVVVALNGWRVSRVSPGWRLEVLPDGRLAVLSMTPKATGTVKWRVESWALYGARGATPRRR